MFLITISSKVNATLISMGVVNMCLVIFVENVNKDSFLLIMSAAINIVWQKFSRIIKQLLNNQKWLKNKKLKEEFLKVMKKQLKLFLLGKFNSLNSLSILLLTKFFKATLDILLKSWLMINHTDALLILKLILKKYLFYNLDLNHKWVQLKKQFLANKM